MVQGLPWKPQPSLCPAAWGKPRGSPATWSLPRGSLQSTLKAPSDAPWTGTRSWGSCQTAQARAFYTDVLPPRAFSVIM